MDTLDVTKFDLNSFELKNITIGSKTFNIPNGLSQYVFDYDMRPDNNLIVSISAKLDKQTGIVNWNFVGLNPVSHTLPDDAFAGFLPPNVNAPEGEGSVSFTIKLKNELTNETVVKNKASIVFDYNEPIITNLWLNTIDKQAPISSGLTAQQVDDSKISVSWNSTDNESLPRYHNLYASVNGGQFISLGQFIGNSATLIGEMDNTYSFYIEAVDSVGNAEIKQPMAETTIKMVKTGLENIFDKDYNVLSIFPNPTSNYFTIKDIEEESAIQITDISGKIIIQKKILPHEKILVINLSKGIYLVKVNDKTAKLLVK